VTQTAVTQTAVTQTAVTQTAHRFHCASWNIHRGKGNDGRTDPARTAAVMANDICTTPLDALVLQEADSDHPPHRGFLDMALVEKSTGLRSVHTAPHHRWGTDSHGFLGVIIMVHPDWQVQDVTLLDLPGHCHRGAVIVDLTRSTEGGQGANLRLIGTHLSLGQALRVVQMRTLGQHLFRRAPRQTVLCGDLNEWRPWGGAALSARVSGLTFQGPARATFPIRRPFLALDRVLATAPARVVSTSVLDSAGIRIASDHRPLRAEVALAATPTS
jgi:endonuclease/exonuclease/phosphatase family metal-dependent hydrolase